MEVSATAMMGSKGLTEASKIAIQSANYMAKCLGNHYPFLFRSDNGTVSHDLIVGLRDFLSGISPSGIPDFCERPRVKTNNSW